MSVETAAPARTPARRGGRAGWLDELQIHLVPLLPGDGVRLLDNLGPEYGFEITRVLGSPTVTHLKYRLTRPAGKEAR